ncbi:MAG: type II toxin-antitoxin system HicB family antitoxin [Oligoflexia bacterium]|nr:type II toxin-antitoxin system HicB family antitoxin [Oligoflexia bacterium]
MIDKYTYRVEWSEEDKVHLANCLEFPSLMAHGSTPEEALEQIKIVVAETVKWMKKEKESIPEPLGLKNYKGNLTLRVSPEIHKALAIKSAEQGISINQYILSKIA